MSLVVPLAANHKAAWVENDGDESAFVSEHGRALGLILNPAKLAEPDGRFLPDLYSYRHNTLADLKTQRTRFNTADRFGIDPDFCVTLNVMDLVRYGAKYGPAFLIYFWLQHPGNPANGVYGASVKTLEDDITANRRQIHGYQTRDGSDGNKTHSFALDVRAMRSFAR